MCGLTRRSSAAKVSQRDQGFASTERARLCWLLMPCSYVIDKKRHLVVSTAWGCLTVQEMKLHDDQLRNDSDFSPEFSQLADGTRIERILGSGHEVGLAVSRSLFSETSKRAFVASTPFIFGMARMATSYIEVSGTPSQVGVFYDIASALKWLGLEEPLNPD